jgi:hypothetical protein
MRRIVTAMTVAMIGVVNPAGFALQAPQATVPAPAAAQRAYDQAAQAKSNAQGDAQDNGQGGFKLTVSANIVLNNVTVRDKKTGEIVKGLKASDFSIVEDKKPQKIVSFDFQNVDEAAVLQTCWSETLPRARNNCGIIG